jgi:hypothetical protein
LKVTNWQTDWAKAAADGGELKVEYDKTTNSTIATGLKKEGQQSGKHNGKEQTKVLYAGRSSRLYSKHYKPIYLACVHSHCIRTREH